MERILRATWMWGVRSRFFRPAHFAEVASIKFTTLEGARSLAFPGAALPIWLYQCEVA